MTADDPVGVTREGAVAVVEMRRPPHNFFDLDLIRALADAMETLDRDPGCRAIVLAAQGTAFCAGGNFSERADGALRDPGADGGLYAEAVRLFRIGKPIIGAIHGAAIGGGLGLALVPDFRVTCPEARFSANFTRLGVHPGFGLTVTLPRLIGAQQASLLFLTGRRIGGAQAVAIGLADELVEQAQVRSAACALAAEVAVSAPLAVVSTRKTLRAGLVEQIQAATRHEAAEQRWLFATADFAEGVAAMTARRVPVFQSR
ncbi:MAG: enoyl-CoA hydratase/isomerase family protein [Burkholderiales bacterium]|nr:enoyl-CoA hydratase/isomerase family protein [Burkholderiales bacterium]